MNTTAHLPESPLGGSTWKNKRTGEVCTVWLETGGWYMMCSTDQRNPRRETYHKREILRFLDRYEPVRGG